MQAGDFTTLAEAYARHRPDYSATVLTALLRYVAADAATRVADVGAGTGIWTRMLASSGLSCVAVEPNEEMRKQGMAANGSLSIRWQAGTAESTGLADHSIDWVTMASSFHWADADAALREFHRVLRPGGFLTVLWNPREIEGHPLFERIEALVNERIADLQRVSSGSKRHAQAWDRVLLSNGLFEDVIFFEAAHPVVMTVDRYMGAWRSVCDVQRQAGPVVFEELLREIEAIVRPLGEITVPYQTRAWTASASR